MCMSCQLQVASVTKQYVEMGGRRGTGLPSPSSSCGSMASMASMVAEGGGGEQVTPLKPCKCKMQPQRKGSSL